MRTPKDVLYQLSKPLFLGLFQKFYSVVCLSGKFSRPKFKFGCVAYQTQSQEITLCKRGLRILPNKRAIDLNERSEWGHISLCLLRFYFCKTPRRAHGQPMVVYKCALRESGKRKNAKDGVPKSENVVKRVREHKERP